MRKVNFIEVTDITESPGAEPVLIQDMKDYLRIEGFLPEDESPSTSIIDFDDDDSLISDLITAARKMLEKAANISLIPHTFKGLVTNMAGRTELLYSPIGDITELLDSDGNEITSDNYSIVGVDRKYLKFPLAEDMVITYETTAFTGKEVEISIKSLVAFMYEHRGDEIEVRRELIRQKADELCSSYTRNAAWG